MLVPIQRAIIIYISIYRVPSAGVYRRKIPEMAIDINDIPDLQRISKDNDSLIIGGNLSLSVAMETFEKYSKEPKFEYLQHLAKHIDLIASVPVRNVNNCNLSNKMKRI